MLWIRKHKVLTKAEIDYILNLLPEWTKKRPPEGLDPTMYGTGTWEGDNEVYNKVRDILIFIRQGD